MILMRRTNPSALACCHFTLFKWKMQLDPTLLNSQGLHNISKEKKKH